MQGVKFAPSMGYGLKLSNPKEFFAESHRPSHFLEFSKLEVRSRRGSLSNNALVVYPRGCGSRRVRIVDRKLV